MSAGKLGIGDDSYVAMVRIVDVGVNTSLNVSIRLGRILCAMLAYLEDIPKMLRFTWGPSYRL